MATNSPASSTASQTLARLRAGDLQGCKNLDLRGCGLTELPPEVLDLSDTLEVLDVSFNDLTELPEGLSCLTRLHTFFASGNRFASVPSVLGRLPLLDTLGFKANVITDVPDAALAPTLRWLILTDNRIAALPRSLVDCARMQKLMLAGNRLTKLPTGTGRLQRLELLRLSANAFERVDDALPDELLSLPQLSWLAHAGNPFSAHREQVAQALTDAASIPWAELQMQALLGEGASGQIHAAHWLPATPADAPSHDVAVKLFKGEVTSDGLPQCEMAATLAAGTHPHLVGVLGVLEGHPQGVQGLVLPRLGQQWSPLAGPPSMVSCSRDIYSAGLRIPAAHAEAIIRGASEALEHLHARGLTHGDLYAHNLLVDGEGGALVSDFGAASFLPLEDADRVDALKVIDRRALQVLVSEVTERSEPSTHVR